MERLHSKFELLVNAVKNKMGRSYISALAKDLYSSTNTYMNEHRFGGKIRENLNVISVHAQRIWSISKKEINSPSEEPTRVYEEIYQYIKEIQKEFVAISNELKIALREISL